MIQKADLGVKSSTDAGGIKLDSKNLKQAGLKITAPRVKILQILEEADQRHLSAEDVYQQLRMQEDDVSLATVYRVLSQFEAAGLVVRHNFEGGHFVFELDNREHHDHIVCVRCGRVEEFVDELIEKRQEEIAKKMQYKITDHSLYIFGVCAACVNNN